MAVHKIRKGLRLPIRGEPVQTIERGPAVRRVAILADDHVGMRPTMHVSVGDDVRRGQLLFEDKKRPGVRFTAPGAGTVEAVHRGERRALRSVVIALTASERSGTAGGPDEARFSAFADKHPSGLARDEVRDLLVESGQWTAIRTRPFSRTPATDSAPDSIFVTAMDTSPLGPDLDIVADGRAADLDRGLAALSKLTDGTVFVCTAPDSRIDVPDRYGVRHERFSGPHPAGTAGVHIHMLDPVGRRRTAWHVGLQDVLAIGHLFGTGRLDVERVISLAGPPVASPRLLRTRLGASIDELVGPEGIGGDVRTVSGSVLAGRTAMGPETGYLGRFHQQVSVLAEDRKRVFLGWLGPGFGEYSLIRAFASALTPRRKFAMTTTTHGSRRAIVPIGMYEKVMAMDIPPTFLLRALLSGDVERAEQLGCLELDEEDLALCTFVCPGKNDYGPYLRDILSVIEAEG